MAEIKRTYYKSGKLLSECFEINGVKNGEFKKYHENGQLRQIYTYVNDKINGEYKDYYENGCELFFKHKNMLKTDFFGQLCVICTYVDGKLNGEYTTYYSNGDLEDSYIYINGIKIE